MVFARRLTPDDFGLVTTAIIVVSFAQIFWEMGQAKAVVQTDLDGDSLLDSAAMAHRTNMLFLIGLLVLVIGLAEPLATAVGDPRIAGVP